MGPVLRGKGVLLDTNILIDFLKGYEKAVVFLSKSDRPLLISTITVAELYSGVKGKDEENDIEDLLQRFQIIPVLPSIAKKGGLLKKSYGVGIADAIIAATALDQKAKLITLNVKHFPMVELKEAPY